MEELLIQLEYGEGPIWRKYFDVETKRHHTGIPIVDNDEIAQRLNDEIQDMESSYYEFNSHDMPLWINGEKAWEEMPKKLYLLVKLKERLEEINDGSYTIVDYETSEIIRCLNPEKFHRKEERTVDPELKRLIEHYIAQGEKVKEATIKAVKDMYSK